MRPVEWASEWLIALVRPRSPAFRLILGLLLAAVGLSISFWSVSAHSSRWYTLAGSFCRIFGLVADLTSQLSAPARV